MRCVRVEGAGYFIWIITIGIHSILKDLSFEYAGCAYSKPRSFRMEWMPMALMAAEQTDTSLNLGRMWCGVRWRQKTQLYTYDSESCLRTTKWTGSWCDIPWNLSAVRLNFTCNIWLAQLKRIAQKYKLTRKREMIRQSPDGHKFGGTYRGIGQKADPWKRFESRLNLVWIANADVN